MIQETGYISFTVMGKRKTPEKKDSLSQDPLMQKDDETVQIDELLSRKKKRKIENGAQQKLLKKIKESKFILFNASTVEEFKQAENVFLSLTKTQPNAPKDLERYLLRIIDRDNNTIISKHVETKQWNIVGYLLENYGGLMPLEEQAMYVVEYGMNNGKYFRALQCYLKFIGDNISTSLKENITNFIFGQLEPNISRIVSVVPVSYYYLLHSKFFDRMLQSNPFTALIVSLNYPTTKQLEKVLGNKTSDIKINIAWVHYLIKNGKDEKDLIPFIDLLLKNQKMRAQINRKTFDGLTALMFAADKGFALIVHKLLYDYHADIYLTDNNGKTAAQIAQKKGHHAVADKIAEFDLGQLQENRYYVHFIK